MPIPLVFSTLIHLLAIPFSPSLYYSTLIFTSTTISALWHYTDTPVNSNLGVMDHLISIVWFFSDIGYTIDDNNLYMEVIVLNLSVGVLNPFLSSFDYTMGHSTWHIISAIKAIYVANLLTSHATNHLL